MTLKGSNPTRASNILEAPSLGGFSLALICTEIAHCFELFHRLERAFGPIFAVVTLSCTEAGMA